MIIRLYECHGAGAKAELQFKFNVKAIQLVNLMEEHIQDLKLEKGGMELVFKPFEIHALKLVLSK